MCDQISILETVNGDNETLKIAKGITYFKNDFLKSGEMNEHGAKTLIVPKEVEVIEEGAFQYCETLETVIFEDEDIILCRNAFLGCKNLKKVVLGETEYTAHCIQSMRYPYYTNHVMIAVDSPEVQVEEGCRVYELREFYPTMNGQGIVGGCYVKLNEKGEEVMVSSQLSDFTM